MVRRLILGGLVVLIAAVWPSRVQAQTKQEIALMVGRTFVSSHDIVSPVVPFNNRVNFGRGLAMQANYARRLRRGDILGLSFEVPVVGLPDVDLNSGNTIIPASYWALFATPSIRANFFPGTGLSPWASVGGGYAHFTTSDHREFGLGPNPGERGTNTSVFQFGAGIDVRSFWKNITIRGEVRDFYSGVPNLNLDLGRTRQHNVTVTGGVVFHF
jgi:hypothetical protein